MFNKKVYAVVMAMAMTASLLAGCGSSSDSSAEASTEASTEAEETKTYADDAYLSNITASDYVELPDYSEIPVEVADPREDVTDEAVETQIETNLTNAQSLTEVTDRDVAESGDVANIDYVGKLDGEAFDGGTASGYDLELGSGTFIDGFEDGVIGMKVGETKTLTLTFPEDYGNSDLAGKETTFDVTLNSIQAVQTPELTDEWVAGLGLDDVTTVDEYRAYIKNQLTESAEETYHNNVQNAAAEYVLSNSTWKQDPPTAMVDRLYDESVSYYQTMASYYSMDYDTMLGYMGITDEDIRTEAEDTARQYICMQALADAEGLNLEGDDYDNAVADLASQYGYDDVDSFTEMVGDEDLNQVLTLQNVATFLENNAVVTAPAEDDADEASTEAAAE